MSERGQALVESLLFFLLFGSLLAALVIFARWFLIHQKLLTAAREGALLYSSGRLKPVEVQQQLRRFLSTGSPAFDDSRLQLKIGRRPGWQALAFRLDEVRVRYRPDSFLSRFFPQEMEEVCVIKHAPSYYRLPVPLPAGPPVLW